MTTSERETSRHRTVLLLLLLTGAGIAACEMRRGRTATAPAPEDVFVSEHGFRIPIEDKEAFLKCVEEEREDASVWFLHSGPRPEDSEEKFCDEHLRAQKNPPLFTPDMTPDEVACVMKRMGRQAQIRWPDGRLALCSRATPDSTAAGER